MNFGDVLLSEAINGFLLIPLVIGVVLLRRWLCGRPVFTERDWLFLFGHERREALRARFWLRFVAFFVVVVTLGVAISVYVLPYGAGWFAGAIILAVAGILRIVPLWMR